MAIWTDFYNFIVPIKNIEANYPGGFVQCLNDHAEWIGRKVWFDDHLFHYGSMSANDLEDILVYWKSLGFEETETVNGEEIAKDFCVVERLFHSHYKCPWLTWLDPVVIHLTGTTPGLLRGPQYLDEEKIEFNVQTTVLHAVKANLIDQHVDVIVNAANPSLVGRGGVSGQILAGGGTELLNACKAIGGCLPGNAVMTAGFNLPARWITHAVGPVWHGGDRQEVEVLRACYIKILDLAAEKGLKTLAIPAISTGIFRFPLQLATEIAIKTITEHPAFDEFAEVRFCCWDDRTLAVYQSVIQSFWKTKERDYVPLTFE